MSDERINDRLLDEIAESYAQEIVADAGLSYQDGAHEYADGSEWVIYYSKAHELCANCNTDNGEMFLEDVGILRAHALGDDVTYDTIASIIAYGELYHRICERIADIQAAQRDGV